LDGTLIYLFYVMRTIATTLFAGMSGPLARFIGLMRSFAVFLFALCPALFAASQPNVIVILADDLGWSDTTLYGNTTYYQTPNVERLAKRGMTFTRAYSASPLCSPTRSALLTGQSPARTGITVPNCHEPRVVLQATTGKKAPPDQKAIMPDPVTRLKTEYRTLAETLKDAGYATAHFGKWHLGPEPYSPLQQGFDVDLPHHPGPGPAGSFVAPWKFANFKEKSPGEHIEDRMAAEAVAWMEQTKDKPFYMNYWMFSVHAPFDAKKANIEKHRGRVDPKDAQRSPTYAAMIQSMDDAIGTLLDGLDRLKLADNTIIVFTADNGGNMYNEVDGTTPTSNRPLRGGKATMFEGGTRVPCVVVWPGIATPGSRSDALVQSEMSKVLHQQRKRPVHRKSLLPAGALSSSRGARRLLSMAPASSPHSKAMRWLAKRCSNTSRTIRACRIGSRRVFPCIAMTGSSSASSTAARKVRIDICSSTCVRISAKRTTSRRRNPSWWQNSML
jgi:hypothetical protein